LPADILTRLQAENKHLQKKNFAVLQGAFTTQLAAARGALTEETARDIVLAIEHRQLTARLYLGVNVYAQARCGLGGGLVG